MAGIDFVWIFSILMAIWWWRIAMSWRSAANDWKKASNGWRERYHEVLDLGVQVKKIAEDRQKDVDLLRKICNAWQVMAPMSTAEALRTKEDAIVYLGKLDQIMGFATDSEMSKELDDQCQNNLADAVVKMEKIREEIESFLDNFQD